MQKGMNFLSKI